jgi:dTDP-4-amino-4,6-dideoxygalactose transaminase
MDRVPVLDLTPEHDMLWDELQAEALRVLRSGRFVLGPDVEAFEQDMADYLGVRHAIGLNSGTDALVIGLRALGIGPGDEVITTPFTFFATAEAISLTGAKPVFVDIEPDSFNLDPRLLEDAITERTRAIIPVHLFGRPVDWTGISEVAADHDLRVLEDAAQSIGARFEGRMTGALGDAGTFSFYPTKNLGAFGDGGMLVTSDDQVAETARMLRNHGELGRYQNEMLGYNSRLDALQAALLSVKLRHLDEFNALRRAAALRYGALLAGIDGITAPAVTDGHVFHQYTIRVHGGRRDEVRETLDEAGIGTMIYYPVPCHRLPVYAEEFAAVSLSVAEAAADEVLSLPIWPSIDPEVQERVVGALREAVGS